VLREPRHPLRRREDRSAWWKVLIRDNAQAQTPEEKKLAQQRIDGTKALVNALAPVRNCPEVVKATVGTEVPAPE
jgi:phage terminase large subunit-like protein